MRTARWARSTPHAGCSHSIKKAASIANPVPGPTLTKNRTIAEFCESGAKALADEGDD